MVFGLVNLLVGLFFLSYFIWGSDGSEPPWAVFVFAIVPLLLGGWVIYRNVIRGGRRYK